MQPSDPFDIPAYVDAAAAACGLTLDAAARSGVIANLARTHAFAKLLETDPTLAGTEPAPVFAPDAPDAP
jgi:hypothetical protein